MYTLEYIVMRGYVFQEVMFHRPCHYYVLSVAAKVYPRIPRYRNMFDGRELLNR